MVTLLVDGERVSIELDRVINAGYSGRDQESVQSHIDEMLKDDVIAAAPERVPTAYQVAPYTLLADPGTVHVVGEDTSGEAEFALFVTGRETYVAAASDQTDRALEKHGIQLSKQIAPNVVSERAWRLSDVRERWDQIEIVAWNTVDGDRRRYQDATLASILPPEEIIEEVQALYPGALEGTAILSGTVPTVDGELTPGKRFEVELHDPVRDRTLSVAYDVQSV